MTQKQPKPKLHRDEHGELIDARIDRWLWSVRMFTSRSEATKRKLGRRPQRQAGQGVGDREAGRPDRGSVPRSRRILEVVKLIPSRVGAKIAVDCYLDHTPPPTPEEEWLVGQRDQGMGRPTKSDRHQIDRLRNW
ncbi:MAG: RNA-binding S4 domain-containing protein [Ilumatobacteraceae bacterium]